MMLLSALTINGFGEGSSGSSTPSAPAEPADPLMMTINYPYQIWSDDPTKIHLVLFYPDFSPAESAIVKVNGDLAGETDANGTCIFDFIPRSDKDHRISAEVRKDGKLYELTKTFSCNSRTASFELDRLYLYTDRGVYNPGQKIHIRIIAWKLKGEYTPSAKEEVQVLLRDSLGKVISGELLRTDEFGIASSKVQVPLSLPEGEYKLEVIYRKAREETLLRIRRFAPPVIRIEHDMKRYLTDAEKKLSITGKLGYFAGGRFKGGTLNVSFCRKNGLEVYRKEIKAISDAFRLELAETELDTIRRGLEIEKQFDVVFQIIDDFGQKSRIVWDCNYTSRPYFAVIELDKDAYQPGEKTQILAKLVDIDGLSAKGVALALAVSSMDKALEAVTDENGVARFEFLMPDGAVDVVLSSKLMKSTLAEKNIPIQQVKPMNSKVSEKPEKTGIMTTIKVSFDNDYVPVEKVVHIDLTDISGSLVASETIPVVETSEGYSAEGRITAKTWGTMLANLYCCAVKREDKDKPRSASTVGFITEGQHVTIYPEKKINISFKGVPDRAAPGEKLDIILESTGNGGESCLGVSIVDDAVISMLDPLIRTPFSHFYNPHAKVIATGGSAVLTWPRVDRNWGSPCDDIAYCNWGWKEPGNPHRADDLGFGYSKQMLKKNSHIQPSVMMESSDSMAPCDTESDQYGSIGGFSEDMAAEKSSNSPAPMMSQQPLTERSREQKSAKQQEIQPKIIIRKNFPETSLWEPSLVTSGGQASLSAVLPDSVTTQTLTVLATDKNGFIGLERKKINVYKELYVQTDFPEFLVAGDRITGVIIVTNHSTSERSGDLRIVSETARFYPEEKKSFTIAPEQSVSLEWEIFSAQAGIVEYAILLDSGEDREKTVRSIEVVPPGMPLEKQITGNFRGTFESSFNIDPNAVSVKVHASVVLPEVFPVDPSWIDFRKQAWNTPWGHHSLTAMNCAVLDFYHRAGRPQKEIDDLTEELKNSAARIQSGQSPDGGWHVYNRQDSERKGSVSKFRADLYNTVTALHALSELRDADIFIDDDILFKGMDYVLKNADSNGLWSARSAYFWEHFNEKSDLGLSSGIFEVLMHASSVTGKAAHSAELGKLKERFLKLLNSGIQEPMVAASVINGLRYWAYKNNDTEVLKLLGKKVDELIRLKRKGYWEPHWYHAYGGMIELNARILELLAATDKEKYRSFLREGVNWLLGTRESWGSWHNEVGTASAIRALLKCATFKKEKKSEISARLNGRPVASLNVLPEDPFLSAAKLSHFDLLEGLEKGKNEFKVFYDGNLEASVNLVIEQWGLTPDRKDETGKVVRKSPSSVELGHPVKVDLQVTGGGDISMLSCTDWIPANTEIDVNSLEELKFRRTIIDYEISGRKLVLIFEPVKNKTDLTYTLKSTRRGKAFHPGTEVRDLRSGRVIASAASELIEIK